MGLSIFEKREWFVPWDSQSLGSWKIPHIAKGLLTWVPALNKYRLRRMTTGGSDSARYCYSVWLRHLAILNQQGFKIAGAHIGELGPGDSIGVGLSALLSGAARYMGLDVVPFSLKSDLPTIFHDLVQLYSSRESIPDHLEFPRIYPRLDSYDYPDDIILDRPGDTEWVEEIQRELKTDLQNGKFVCYRAPWTSPKEIMAGSLDLIFSQAVLEHVDSVDETYSAMFAWLKSGGYASHVIDFSAHYLSPFWNGHWAYSDWEWKMVRGRREYLLNREPLSTHLACAKKAGFEIVYMKREYGNRDLRVGALAQRFQTHQEEDLKTKGVMLILRKP
jgi:hypothetical protein